jgi:hypothetical protein
MAGWVKHMEKVEDTGEVGGVNFGWLGGWACECGVVAYSKWQKEDHDAECVMKPVDQDEAQGVLF